jgi:organic radical activating enzyme
MTVPVSEAFGAVWQGEGPHAGRRCSFLRLGLCNLHCEWCDTPYTWDSERFDVAQECPPWTADQIIDAITAHDTSLLVLSGGEPLIHQGNYALLEALDRLPHDVHVETNGTLTPTARFAARVAHWSVSPKVAQDADPWHRRIRPVVLSWFAQQPNAILKVVCRDADDVHRLADEVDGWGLWRRDAIWIMPEGVTAEAVTGSALRIADAVASHGWNLPLRQHTLMYGTERAR